MDYREYAPSTANAQWLQCLWRWRDPEPSDHVQTIYPDGRCEIILHLGAPLQARSLSGQWEAQAKRLFSGQQRAPIQLRPGGPIDCIGIRLRPAASLLIGGDYLPGLRDRIVRLDDVQSSLDAELASFTRQTADTDVLQATLAEWSGASLAAASLHGIIDRIDASEGRIALAELARGVGVSSRTLQQRFLQQVGMTLQEYRRVLRLQSTLRRLDTDDGSLADIATDAGFSDQSHATREMMRLTGLTPARLLRALRADPDDEGTRKLAAAFVRGRA
ncbi:MAG: AraC family transcriptional regulator [Lysobacteraceae bacterium]